MYSSFVILRCYVTDPFLLVTFILNNDPFVNILIHLSIFSLSAFRSFPFIAGFWAATIPESPSLLGFSS